MAIVAAMVALMFTPLGDTVRASTPDIREKAESLGFLRHYVEFSIFLSLAHSFLEEYYWRWFVFGNLRSLISPKAAVLAGSLAFAAHHLVITAQFFPIGPAVFFAICVAIGGMLWCLLYQRQGTLAGAWLSHIVVDAGLMGVGYWLLK